MGWGGELEVGGGLGGREWVGGWGVGWGVGGGWMGREVGGFRGIVKEIKLSIWLSSYSFPYYTQIFRIHIKMALFYRKRYCQLGVF